MPMFDVIVGGGGPAGLSAALMLGRRRRRVLVCDTGEPRNRFSRALRGYLTRDGVCPAEFNELGRDELARYAIECRKVAVIDAQRLDGCFRLTLQDGRAEQTKFLLLATGVVDHFPEADAIFFITGQHPQRDLAARMGCIINRRGTVNTGNLSETNVPGVFVAGDASRDAQFVVVAAAEGVKAALAINQAMQREELVA